MPRASPDNTETDGPQRVELAKHTQAAKVKHGKIAKKDTEIVRRKMEIVKRDQDIATKEKEIVEKQKDIKTKEGALAKKDKQLAKKDTKLIKKGKEFKQKGKEIKKLNEEVEKLKKINEECKEEADALRGEEMKKDMVDLKSSAERYKEEARAMMKKAEPKASSLSSSRRAQSHTEEQEVAAVLTDADMASPMRGSFPVDSTGRQPHTVNLDDSDNDMYDSDRPVFKPAPTTPQRPNIHNTSSQPLYN
ncbi:hypothetical protein CPB83DRAFT_900087 [Crepidotus variabilis]|uniref:Uncharacterized protein n=1 Tax=Crepidotus variabilis TaxID=179855 RepID=A0A9P6E3N4_9AGAR|nr:hypothetical protein CPB83DRAFT_900087 [Crepidotus variabilis]